MWLIILVWHQVNHTFGAVFWGCAYESAVLFDTTEHCAKLWFKWMDFMPRKPSTAPQLFILKTMEQCGGFNAVWTDSLGDTFWILMWSQRSETFPPGTALWRLTETGFCQGQGEKSTPEPDLLVDLTSRHKRKWTDVRDPELFFMFSQRFAHSPYS